jgi:hypothetical protein
MYSISSVLLRQLLPECALPQLSVGARLMGFGVGCPSCLPRTCWHAPLHWVAWCVLGAGVFSNVVHRGALTDCGGVAAQYCM